MNIFIAILNLIIIGALVLFWLWLKQLPASIHKKQEQIFQQQLSKELEMLKISQSQIQLRKIEKFIDFAKLQTDILANEEFKSKILNKDSKAMAEINKLTINLGIGIFFFASDSSIRQYGEWKTKTAKGESNPFTVLSDLGSLMVALRKDVGYEKTELDGKDYLKLFITDWDDIKEKIK